MRTGSVAARPRPRPVSRSRWRSSSRRASGRIRLQTVLDVSKASLIGFVKASIEPAATVRTDGWRSYLTLPDHGYTHERVVMTDGTDAAHVAMPGAHRVASLLKRWLLGSHQGAVEAQHLDAYLNEFTFRFNRRRSQARGLLFYRLLDQAVHIPPVTFKTITGGKN